MDFFKEYGTTQEEILNAITDALEEVESENTKERLKEALAVLKKHFQEERTGRQ